MRIYLSAGKERPDDTRLGLLVEDARLLWADIPSGSLPAVVNEAIAEAGGFPASNGLVARVWRDRGKRELDLGAGCRMSLDQTQHFLEKVKEADKLKATPNQAAAMLAPIRAALGLGGESGAKSRFQMLCEARRRAGGRV